MGLSFAQPSVEGAPRMPRFMRDDVLYNERLESTYRFDQIEHMDMESIMRRESQRTRMAKAHAREVRCHVVEDSTHSVVIVYYLIGTSSDHFQGFLEECNQLERCARVGKEAV